jgi:chromosome segregation ATPase
LPALTKAHVEAREQKQQVDERILQKKSEETISRANIRELEQGQRQWIDSYPNAPALGKLLKAVANESRFRETPVGPMGRYVELLRPEWASILEKSFGASLNAFVVTSKDDHTILSDMMRRHN